MLNASTGRTERVARIYRMMGDRRDNLEAAGPGEIVAVVGLKNTHTGNTLCATAQPLVLEEIRFPEPVISQAILPDRNTDEARLADALGKLVRDDPTLAPAPIRRPVSSFSRAWASCTWKSRCKS